MLKKSSNLRHEGEEDVTVITQDSVVGAFNKILTALTIAVACIGGVSASSWRGCLVMNVMLVSVTQRTAEIGLLKAIGASQHQIQVRLFLAEAILIGLGIGALVGFVLRSIAHHQASRANYPKFPA